VRHDDHGCLFFTFRHFDHFLYHHFMTQVRWVESPVCKHDRAHIIMYTYNNMNAGVIIGIVVLVVVLIILYMTMGGDSEQIDAPIIEDDAKQPVVDTNRVSTKDASIGIYSDCDCEDAITSSEIKSGAEIDVSGKGEMQVSGDQQWRCVKGTNIKLFDYVHEFSGVLAGEEVDTTLELPEHDREPIEIKVGCGEGDNITTENIKFKWEVKN